MKALYDAQMKWSRLNVTLAEIADDNRQLIHEMSRYDRAHAVPLLASLLTIPKYQSNCIRLEILVALAEIHCGGHKTPNIREAVRWFRLIGNSKCAMAEDPAEDVFVTLVQDQSGDYRLIEGISESSGFYTQRVLDVVSTMPDSGIFHQIKRCCHALLLVSDLVCEKAGLRRYTLGPAQHNASLSPNGLPSRRTLTSTVVIPVTELEMHGVTPADLEPFFFHPQMRAELRTQQMGNCLLDSRPLIAYRPDAITVAVPSTLSVAVRNFVISNVVAYGMERTFDATLAAAYSSLLSDTFLLGGPYGTSVTWNREKSHQWSAFSFKVDQGYFVSLHLFLPSVTTHTDGGFKEMYHDDGAIRSTLETSLNFAASQIETQNDFRGAMVIIVGCGWGKGYEVSGVGFRRNRWRQLSMSIADLVRLSKLADMTPSRFWRIQDGLDSARKAGVQLINPNGILNLVGWLQENDGHFVPHAQLPETEISAKEPIAIQLPTNLLREVRGAADNGYDYHVAIDNVGTLHNVQHISPDPFFPSDSEFRFYGSLNEVRAGRLAGVYEGRLTLWLSVDAPNMTDLGLVTQLWDMAREWTHRIGDAFDKHADIPDPSCPVKVYVQFLDPDPPESISAKPRFEQLMTLWEISPRRERDATNLRFKTGFISGFAIAENVAERIFVHALADAFLRLLGIHDTASLVDNVTAEVVPNQDARNFHLMQAHSFTDYVADMLPKKLVALEPIDGASIALGLGWKAHTPDQGNRVVGRSECTEFLKTIVRILLDETGAALKCYQRLPMLTRLVENAEKAREEQDHWNRTSAAILGLHGHTESTMARYAERMSLFAGAAVASRILIEMSLCACPTEGGIPIADIELSKLMAKAAMAVHFGGLSDAIHYNALPPEIKISALGDILFRNELGHLVVEPMLARVMSDRFVSTAPAQRKNYEQPQIVPEVKGRFSEEFWNAWAGEMGFDIDEGRRIIGSLEDSGVKRHAAVFYITRSEYLALAASADVTEEAANAFLAQFCLSTRPEWDKAPRDFKPKDIYPWRFGRRLSFVSRPILGVNNNDDPLLLIAPGALRQGFTYVLDGAYSGRLDQSFFHTNEMKHKWWGKASEGHTFTSEVADALSKAGWHTRENIGLPEVLNRKLERDFGDIDVLAWRLDRNEILAIECKDLSLARNYSEVAELLSEYQGVDVDGKPDKLKKHLDRIALLQGNLAQVRRFTSAENAGIASCLVFSGIVPMQYAHIEALADTHVGGIDDILKL